MQEGYDPETKYNVQLPHIITGHRQYLTGLQLCVAVQGNITIYVSCVCTLAIGHSAWVYMCSKEFQLSVQIKSPTKCLPCQLS